MMRSGDHTTWTELAQLLYKLESVRQVRSADDMRHGRALHGLLILEEAEGSIDVSGYRYPLQPEQAYLLKPGAEVKLNVRPDDRLNGCYLQFQALQATGSGAYAPARMSCADVVGTVHARLLLGKAREAMERLAGAKPWEMLEANTRLQEMIALLLKDMNRAEENELKQAVHRAKDYMEQNYHRDITRETLAELAGLHPDYFSRAFKRQFQKSPVAYLNELRIQQARKLLVQSGESIRSVAQNVGFSDEFYFSRKFKLKTGSSPAAYVKQLKTSGKIASLNHLITGHLVALGIEPYAAIINNSFPVAGQLGNTIEVGRKNLDFDKLVTARPDLIVTRGFRYSEQTPREKVLGQIAPTITLPYTESWRAHFLSIARMIGREKEAAGWMDRYDSSAAELSRQIKLRTGEESFLVLGIGENRMCVYGRRNIGTVLYDDLRLAMPEEVMEIGHYREITLKELPDFQADRILLTIFRQDNVLPSENGIRRQLQALGGSAEWQSLRAVREGKVYGMYDSQHLYTSYNPLSHDLFLRKFSEMLLGNG